MFTVGREEFEKLVQEGMRAIPEEFLRKIDNVSIVIGDEPTPAQRRKLDLHPEFTLLGLYEGVPLVSRGAGYSAVPPDKITIFQRTIEARAADREGLQRLVKDVVWHEVAHHFGMDEPRVRRAEARRRKLRGAR